MNWNFLVSSLLSSTFYFLQCVPPILPYTLLQLCQHPSTKKLHHSNFVRSRIYKNEENTTFYVTQYDGGRKEHHTRISREKRNKDVMELLIGVLWCVKIMILQIRWGGYTFSNISQISFCVYYYIPIPLNTIELKTKWVVKLIVFYCFISIFIYHYSTMELNYIVCWTFRIINSLFLQLIYCTIELSYIEFHSF